MAKPDKPLTPQFLSQTSLHFSLLDLAKEASLIQYINQENMFNIMKNQENGLSLHVSFFLTDKV
jgi:hypothetical protein